MNHLGRYWSWVPALMAAFMIAAGTATNADARDFKILNLTPEVDLRKLSQLALSVPRFDVDRTLSPDRTSLSETNYESHLSLGHVGGGMNLGLYYRNEWPTLEDSSSLVETRRSIGFRLFVLGGPKG